MPTFGPPSDDETTDQIGAGGQTVASDSPLGGHGRPAISANTWGDDESTEIVNNAEIGGFFGGRFRIDARLGSGAMGRVLTALDTETGQLVALKVLHRERSRDKNVLRRFAREAASLRAINHRAIVGIVASGRAPDGTPWLAMEHLVGQTLKARIAKHRMQPADFWPILKMLAEAVGEAHARGVVHRDLKPENIFLPDGGDPPCKILDFGLATLNREGADKVTATGQLLGTPRYMAPELLASIGKPDHRVDVFALAVMSFEALTGRSLYSADDLGSLFGQILEARTHSLRQFRPDLPEALEAVLKQGHARSMSDRFQTAGAFATAFAQAAGIGDAITPAPALASLFDEVGDGDGNAPLVDPFGAPVRSTGANPAAPLPPLAADVPPLIPAASNAPGQSPSQRPGRSRVGTHLGVGPDGVLPAGLPSIPQAAPVPQVAGMPLAAMPLAPLPPAAVPRMATPQQPAQRQAVAAAVDARQQETLYAQPAGPAPAPSFGAAAQPGSARGFTPPAPPRFSTPPNHVAGPSAAPGTSTGASPVFAPTPQAAPSTGRNVMGCLLFGIAAVVVIAFAVAGALALRWYLARGGL